MTISAELRGGIALDELFGQRSAASGPTSQATSCTSQLDQLRSGDVFVALDDGAEDGHEQAAEAVRRGAAAVVCERPVAVFDVPTYLVPDSRIALGQLCQALVGEPTRTLPTIGITGTLGKTTTLALLESIFCAAGKHPGTLSSLSCYDGMAHTATDATTLSQPAWAARLARMEAAGCTQALVEVSSEALCQQRLAGIELDAVCVTNVTSAHLDLHNSTQNYRDAKRRILDYLSPSGVTILNADDQVSLGWLSHVQGPVLTYGLGAQAEISAQIVERHSNEQLFVLTAGNESVAVRTTLVGDHQVSNCLAATTLALSYGIDLSDCARGIEALDRLPGRMERVDCGQGFPVFVDAAQTPDALRATLHAARQLAEHRVICVLGDSPDPANQSEAVRHVVNRLADLAIVTESLDQFCQSGNCKPHDAVFQQAADRQEAIAWAVTMAEPGDVVVIAGSGTQLGWAFGNSEQTDTELVREILYARNEAVCRLAA